ncbi:hypothetical protein IQ235_14965 [Oscillatoriales cyanobacterium LEGE 11467]|uniref:Uncharacterized protein n=1 Tax=Zarconia navalis LEGE 11467 TaxID=1828826 RepID=A0A928W2J9_9CYAN|nr:hypothetical protein [Zarconia navalis]MBE9042080.1 hypothetical protein [Zarconia navalis LEGE 11467]
MRTARSFDSVSMQPHRSLCPIIGAGAIACALSFVSLGSPARADTGAVESLGEVSHRASRVTSGFHRPLPPWYRTPASRGKQSQECIWLGVDC